MLAARFLVLQPRPLERMLQARKKVAPLHVLGRGENRNPTPTLLVTCASLRPFFGAGWPCEFFRRSLPLLSSRFLFSRFLAVHSLLHTGPHLSGFGGGILALDSARVGGFVMVAYDSVSQASAGEGGRPVSVEGVVVLYGIFSRSFSYTSSPRSSDWWRCTPGSGAGRFLVSWYIAI